MLHHNSYINMAIANNLMSCKGLYNHYKSRNDRSTYQETPKSDGFSTNHHEIEEKVGTIVAIAYFSCSKMFGVVVLIKWPKLRPVLVRYLPFKFEYNRTHISVY